MDNKGIKLEGLSNFLLNCLRISMLHLICSRQSKSEFLALIEESLLSREKDELLESTMIREQDILCCHIS